MKIVIIDDDEVFLEEMVSVLKSGGYDVIPVAESQFAIMTICKQLPDAVILDLKMDGLSGFEIANRLRHVPQTRHIPIICVTGFYTRKEHQLLLQTGSIKEFLIKPFNPLDIIAAIERISSPATEIPQNSKNS